MKRQSINEVKQFQKLAGLLKEDANYESQSGDTDAVGDTNESVYDDPINDQWYEDFENGLKNLANNEYISVSEYREYMKALDHVDPIDNYGEMQAHDAAKEFVDDLRTKNQMDNDEYQYKSEMGGYEPDTDADYEEPNEPFDMAEVNRFKEIAGVSQPADGPEDDDDEEREKRAKKAEMDDEEAENAEREDD